MEMHLLAQKQKRLKSWSKLTELKNLHEDLRLNIVDTLKVYRNTLSKAWEHGEVSKEERVLFCDLERRLEELEKETRLSCP